MLKALLIVLVSSCQGIRMAQPPALAKCPDVAGDTNNVLFWGMILDGKDHAKGKDAYDWHGFDEAYKALSFLLKEKPEEPLEYKHLMKARHICCDHAEGMNFGWAGMKANNYEGPVFRSYTCVECNHMKALIADVPKEFFQIEKGTNKNFARSPSSCTNYHSVVLRPKEVQETQQLFKQLIMAYNADVEKLTNKKDKLVRLAYFLKDFAFLHPWGNGNGRFRTMMLNHEVRRLGLGCGTLMYNNNKDLYYITKKTYIEKIEEGIAMYDKAMDTGKSPWLNEDVVARHKSRFSPNITMPGLMNCRNAEYTKTSYWIQKENAEDSEVADGVNMEELQ
jgi:DNA-directed RNA polymerase subunit M/transcription elongation factor TFIIS